MRSLLLTASQIPPGAPPGRYWLEGFQRIVPGPGATRWLLLVDTVVILLIAARGRRPVVAGVIGIGVAFLALNVLSMLMLDFFLGLAAFHVLTGFAGLGAAPPARWAGAALLVAAVALGVLT